ncbi:MAG: hypothetical protein SGI73_19420, partial [Chloroflexota bacterium]|nr:hypothetical protein [Chloroflexota bacterium]
MSSKLFDSDDYKNVETATKALLSLEPNFLSVRGTSPRSVGDALQEIVAERLQTVLPLYIRGYRNNFERRAMADIAFNDDENNQYVIDVKTHLVSATFGMPNLTSVERLANFYENNRHYFVVLSISYELVQTNLSI